MGKSSEIQRRIRQLDELRNIIGTMRSLAGVRVQQAHATLPGIRHYAESIDRALAEAYPLLPAPAPSHRATRPATGVVAFGSEHGFVGLYNERLVDAVVQLAGDPPGAIVLLAGSRTAEHARERAIRSAWTTAMATHVETVVDVALRLADEVYRRVALGEFQRLVLVYASSSPGLRSQIEVKQVLPFDVAPYQAGETALNRPHHYLPAGELVEKLVEEFVFAELMRAAMEAFASENDARLATMSSAHDNIEKKVGTLEQAERVARQEEITLELLDVVTGALAAETEP